jgi:1-deoxy-D-xylulose-5-phosphate synthase
VFARAVTDFAKKDPKITAITGAMPTGTGLLTFKHEVPDRYFDVGIAEEHAVTFAAGLAEEGAKPFVAIYSTFLQRAFDQILHDVCLPRLPVRFMIDRSGIVGEDGSTHQGIFDLSYLRQLPHMVILAPKDENELRRMIKTALEREDGPTAVRYPRGDGLGVPMDPEMTPVPIGSWEVLREGEEAVILAVGSLVSPAMEASALLQKDGLSVGVINARSVKPLDEILLARVGERSPCIITLEENVLAGGFGSAVVEYAVDHRFPHRRIKRIGLPDEFIEHGDQAFLRDRYGLSPKKIAATVASFMRRGDVHAS